MSNNCMNDISAKNDCNCTNNASARNDCMNNDSANNKCKFGCVGYAYVPVQNLDKIFCPEDALQEASLFPELVISMKEYGKVCTKLGGVE